MKSKLHSLSTKLALCLFGANVVVAFLVAQALVGGARGFAEDLRAKVDGGVALAVARSLDGAGMAPEPRRVERAFRALEEFHPSLNAYLVDTSGVIVACTGGSRSLVRGRLEPSLVRSAAVPAGGSMGPDPRHATRTSPIASAAVRYTGLSPDAEPVLGYVYLVLSSDAHRSSFEVLAASLSGRLTGLLLVGAILLSAALFFASRRLIVNRLNRLRAEFAGGHPGSEGLDEISALGVELDAFRARSNSEVEAARSSELTRSRAFADMSHDLRGAVSGVEGMLMGALGEMEDQNRIEFLETCLCQARRLRQMTEQALQLASLEDAEASLEPIRFSVREVLEDVLVRFQPLAKQDGVHLSVHCRELVPDVIGDVDLVVRALENLVGNSLRYVDSGGHVWIRARRFKGAVRLEVEDDGLGMSEEVRAIVQRRGWHGPREPVGAGRGLGGLQNLAFAVRPPVAGTGFGIGLDLATRIAELHGSTLEIDSDEGLGTVIRFNLPRA